MSKVDQECLLAGWVDNHSDALYRFALSKVNDQNDVEDLLQETFLAALNAHSKFRGDSSVRSWLIAILRLKIYDHYRKKGARGENFELLPREDLPDRRESLRAWNGDAARALENEELWRQFRECTDSLPATLSQAFLMREMDGLSTKTVCEILKIKPGNLSMRLYRARTLLRDCLDKNWFQRN